MYGNLIFLYIFKIITVHYFYCPYFIIPSNFVKLVFENNKLKNKQTIQISGLILQYCSAITLYRRLILRITSFVVQAGTVEAEGLNLTIETLRQRDDSRLDTGDLAQGLVKKVGRHSWFPWVSIFHATANCLHKIWLNIQFESLYGCRQQTNQKHQIHPNNFRRWQRICFEYYILFQMECNRYNMWK